MKKLLLVEDDVVSSTFLLGVLQEYEVVLCRTADAFRSLVEAETPDIVLMDIELGEGESGYELCTWYKENHSQGQVIFLSMHDDIDQITKAYHCGGDDFVIKPVHVKELKAKILSALDRQQKEGQRLEEINATRQMAFDAMCEAGYIGRLLNLSRDVSREDSLDKIASITIGLINDYSIDAVVKLSVSDDFAVVSSHGGDVAAIEVSIMKHLNTMGRIFQFRSHLIINFSNCVVLVKNMPLDDEVRSGVIRDHIAIAAEVVDSRLRAIEVNAQLLQRDQLISTSKEVLARIEAATVEQVNFFIDQRDMIDAVYNNLGRIVHELYLPEQDEERILSGVLEKSNALLASQSDALANQRKISELANALYDLIGAG